MLVGILTKLLYAFVLWRWVLPTFKTQHIVRVFIYVTALLMACLMLEVVVSWQFQEYTLSHMILHPSPIISYGLVIYLVITLVSVGVYFTRVSFQNERQKRVLMENQLTTELDFLHAQINPHFLFNTLNNLFSVAQRDKNDELAISISMLSGLMRYMLYDSKVNRVALEDEITHLKDFIGLGRMRFTKEELEVKLKVEGEIEKATIAPMILLPFVENAFKHGVQIEEKSIIDISIKVENDQIAFRCFNLSNDQKKESLESSGIGMENVKRRLELLYPGKSHLEINDTDDSFEVRLTLQS